MSREQTRQTAEQFLQLLGTGANVETIADMFSSNADFQIPGDSSALPWIGSKAGRDAVLEFFSSTRKLLEPLRLHVDEILANETRAVILGELASRVKSSAKVIETPFCIALTIADGEITRFLMLEDSFAVHKAALSD
jgi:uncharacterized protein